MTMPSLWVDGILFHMVMVAGKELVRVNLGADLPDVVGTGTTCSVVCKMERG